MSTTKAKSTKVTKETTKKATKVTLPSKDTLNSSLTKTKTKQRYYLVAGTSQVELSTRVTHLLTEQGKVHGSPFRDGGVFYQAVILVSEE